MHNEMRGAMNCLSRALHSKMAISPRRERRSTERCRAIANRWVLAKHRWTTISSMIGA